jgi:hypothetical protein
VLLGEVLLVLEVPLEGQLSAAAAAALSSKAGDAMVERLSWGYVVVLLFGTNKHVPPWKEPFEKRGFLSPKTPPIPSMLDLPLGCFINSVSTWKEC